MESAAELVAKSSLAADAAELAPENSKNPWTIATLHAVMPYMKAREREKAKGR